MEELTPDPEFLLELVEARMPFGKYKDRLGKQLETIYVIKANGLEYLFDKLR